MSLPHLINRSSHDVFALALPVEPTYWHDPASGHSHRQYKGKRWRSIPDACHFVTLLVDEQILFHLLFRSKALFVGINANNACVEHPNVHGRIVATDLIQVVQFFLVTRRFTARFDSRHAAMPFAMLIAIHHVISDFIALFPDKARARAVRLFHYPGIHNCVFHIPVPLRRPVAVEHAQNFAVLQHDMYDRKKRIDVNLHWLIIRV
ncbi:hypothetical protein WP1_291 [Pseudomonas phage WP1]